MEDHRLGDLLRELPREAARPGFTARALKGLDRPAGTPRRSLRLAMAGALAAAMAVAAGILVDSRREERATAQAQQALEEIRAEHSRLERELRELSQPPVVYVGGNEEVDLVLDLGKMRRAEGATPAAYRSETF